jgi:uncharacterized protein YuzE
MYRCDVCRVVSEPGIPAHRIVVEAEPLRHPRRPQIYCRKARSPGAKATWLDDPGGRGWRIVREVNACAECAARHRAIAPVPTRPPDQPDRNDPVEARYDPAVDAAYVYVQSRATLEPGCSVSTEIADDGSILDFDRRGRLIGYELLSVRHRGLAAFHAVPEAALRLVKRAIVAALAAGEFRRISADPSRAARDELAVEAMRSRIAGRSAAHKLAQLVRGR